jgi:hypothetical protein
LLLRSAFVWIPLLILFSLSCGSGSRTPLVTVDGKTLYEDDVALILGTTEYSAEERDEVIQAWVFSQMAFVLWDSLPKDRQNLVELKTTDYKASLILFEMENLWIESRLDTVVREDELEQYYQDNIQDFLLNDFIVKLLYLKVPALAPDIDLVKKMFLLNAPSDTAKIPQYANQYATSFYFNRENWISFEDFLKELPVDYIDVERFVTNKSKKVFEENGFFFFINILDYRLKNTPSPFTYEKERIRSRIILNRKLELRQKAKAHFETKLKNNDKIEYHFR